MFFFEFTEPNGNHYKPFIILFNETKEKIKDSDGGN